jgi:hypothetical protein
MSLHDQIALKARLDGNTSAQFRTAAQKHANATWVYLLIAGAVWYLTSWPWALIPAAFAAYIAMQSISATAIAVRLERYENSQGAALKHGSADAPKPERLG